MNKDIVPASTQERLNALLAKSQTRVKQLEQKIGRQLTSQPARRIPHLLGLSDATGSMADLWGAAKCHIKEMVRRLTELGPFKLRWAAYRDYCDGSDLFQSSDWHDSADPLLRFIDRVSCTGGGDFEEAVEYALKCAVEEPIATRIILIGDAPPHPERDFREQATQLGKLGRPVFAFVVGEHAETQEAFAEIARLSGGKSTALRSANDLLDVVVLTVAHEMGGAEEVQQYLQKYSGQLGQGAREYGQLLLGRGSND